MTTKIVIRVPPTKRNIVEITDYGRRIELTCDCGRTCTAIAISETLYEWNCPECGLMRDTDA